MTNSKISFCLISLLLTSACSSSAQPAACPDVISVNQALKTPLAGWTSTIDSSPNRLSGVTFFDGPPEEKASLVNDRTTKAAGKEIAIWHFDLRPKREIWIACGYSGTSVVLAKRLPPKTAACQVTYNPHQQIAGSPLIESIACQEK